MSTTAMTKQINSTPATPTEEAREIIHKHFRSYVINDITSALKAREEAGYNRGVRDAEKAAERFHPCQDGCYCSGEIADEIEKLIKE